MTYHYKGHGEAPPGIPARDITDEEIEARGLDRAVIEASPLWERAKPATKATKPEGGDA